MDPWQVLHITKHKSELIEQTTCNADLLSRLQSYGVLGKADLAQLRAMAILKGEIEQSMLLYDIIQTRVNAYESMTKALHDSKQSGAFKILIEGFDKKGITNPFFVCDIKIDTSTIFNTNIQFRGGVRQLGELLCDEKMTKAVQNVLSNTLTGSQYFESFFRNSESNAFVIMENTIPHQLPYYIPRKLSAQIELHDSFFKSQCLDIFILKNLERSRLTQLASPHLTDASSNQTEVLTVRFILWENDEDILDILKLSQNPVHLVRYDDKQKSYILERTWGDSKIIRHYLTNNAIHLSEEEFLATAYETDSNGLCICDTPGMGKSVLLANLARKIAERDPTRFVAFIELSSFIRSQGDQLHLVQTGSEAMSLLAHYVTPTAAAEGILLELLKNENKRIDLFFDGFDEIHSIHLEWASNFLKKITKFSPQTKLVVASRPHMRHELENLLGIIGFTIVPLDPTDQHIFLLRYWKCKIKPVDETKLGEFVSNCVLNLMKSSTMAERMITGIPLQLFLLAEVYLNIATKYSTPGRNFPLKPTATPFNSIFGMYYQFMDLRLKKETNPKMRQQIKNFHVWKALKLLFPEVAVQFVMFTSMDDIPASEYLLSFGVLEECSTGSRIQTRFVHRTFAEYLVGEFTTTILAENEQPFTKTSLFQSITAALYEHVVVFRERESFKTQIEYPELVTPDFKVYALQNPVVAYFVNGNFQLLFTRKQVLPALLDVFQAEMLKDSSYKILQSCVFHDLPHLFKFFCEGIKSLGNNFVSAIMPNFIKEQRGYYMLIVASRYASVLTIEKCVTLYSDILGYDLCSDIRSLPLLQLTPLHLAAYDGNYSLVEFLLQHCNAPLSGRHVLHTAVYRSNNKTPKANEEIVNICKLLISVDPMIVYECCNNIPPLLVDYLSLPVIKYLIGQGAYVYAKNDDGYTVTDKAAGYMQADDFHELVKYLLLDNGFIELFRMRTFSGRTPLQEAVKNLFVNFRTDTVEIISRIAGIDVYSTDQSGESLLFSAVKGVQHSDLLTFLLKAGSNVNLRNKKGQNILDAIHEFENGFAVYAFCTYAPNLNATDKIKNTLLHQAALFLGPDKFHECVYNVVKSGNIEMLRKQNHLDYSPLEQAVVKFNVLKKTFEIVLAQEGVKANDEQIFGKNILLRAAAIEMPGRMELYKTLVELGFNIDGVDKWGESILHLTCMNLDAVRYFVLRGAKANIRNQDNETPLDKVRKQMRRRVQFNADPICVNDNCGTPIMVQILEAGRRDENDKEEIIQLLKYAEKNN